MKRRSGSARTYSEILDAATKVFYEKGYSRATMQDIADEAGLTKGGVYHYLTSKEGTLTAIEERLLTRNLEDMREIAESDKPVPTRIREVCVYIASIHDRYHKDLHVVLLEFNILTPGPRRLLTGLRNELEELVVKLLQEGIDTGILADVSARSQAKLLFGAFNWMAIWYRPGGKQSAESFGHSFSELLLNGLLLKPERNGD